MSGAAFDMNYTIHATNMECTQKLECTQELYTAETEEPRCPEQIGFLGICGTKYPIKRGPNKIGRDAHMCSIVLKLDSISRTHAVINVLNGKDYMLMDLDSANKTRLNNKVLQAYIPYPLNNGDTVQFGEVFGLFRLLEDENDLPMTQAIDVPDTPMAHKHSARVNKCGVTTVPESPDVSDRDDSFIMPSQPKAKQSFKSPSNKFIKQSGKTTVIQPIGSQQIDNVYWSSSKKSLSLNDSDLNDDSMVTANNTIHQNHDIHEMETQPPFPDNKMTEDKDSIYTADTQMPNISKESIYSANTQHPNDSSRDSIYSAATQIPDFNLSPPIHGLDTQMPEHLPTIQRISDQKDMQFDIFSANKENISIHNAETQIFTGKKSFDIVKDKVDTEEEDIFEAATQYPTDKLLDLPDNTKNNDNMIEADSENASEKHETAKDTSKETIESLKEKSFENNQSKQSKSEESNALLLSKTKEKVNTTSDEEVLFEGIDSQSFEEDFNSQSLIPSEGFEFKDGEPDIPLSQAKLKDMRKPGPVDKVTSKEYDDITILPTQKLATLPGNKPDLMDKVANDPVTSKASDDITMLPTQKLATVLVHEQDLEKKTAIDPVASKECDDVTMLPTQKLSSLSDEDITDCEDNSLENESNKNKVTSFQYSTNKHDSPDMLDDDELCNPEIPNYEMATQVLEEDEILLQMANKNNATEDNISDDVVILDEDFREMATQVIPAARNMEDLPTQILEKCVPEKNNIEDLPTQVLEKCVPEKINIEDLPTQVLEKCVPEKIDIEDLPTQVLENDMPEKTNNVPEQYSEEMLSPFKIPNLTPLRNKKRESSNKSSPIVSNIVFKQGKIPISSKVSTVSPVSSPVVIDDDENYYGATQEILDDLCSQQASPEIIQMNKNARNKSDETQVAPLKKAGSNVSEGEVTPKKVRPLKLMRTELPDSQEIKTSVGLTTNTSSITESSSESEGEEHSEEMTPIVFRKKQRKKKSPTDAKMDLIKKFEASTKTPPARVITRVRKPTAKMLESDLVKPKYPPEQDEEIDKEIITENITRLKHKNDKKNKSNDNNNISNKSKDSKIETKTQKSSDAISKKNKDENSSKQNTNNKRNKPKSEEESKPAVKSLDESSSKQTTNKRNKSKSEEQSKPAVKPLELNSNEIKENISIEIDIENETSGTEKGTRRTRSCRRKAASKSTEDNQSLPPETDTKNNSRTEKGRGKQTQNSKKSTKPNDTTINNNKIVKHKTPDIDADSIQKRKSETETKKPDKEKKKSVKKAEHGDEKQTKTKARGRPKKSVKDSDDDTSSETSVRRSKRQKTVSKNDTIDQYLVDMSTLTVKNNKTVNLEVHELSKVYNISSGSDETPSLKRLATSYMDAPSPKRTRSQSRGARVTPACRLRTQHVLFTAFNNDEIRVKLEKLGAVIVTDVKSSTVVLTVAIKRTFKLLCAVGLGIPIVGPEWVQACISTNMIVDPWQYIIMDEANEKRFQFSMRRTLVSKRGFLKGYHVSSTPKVMPCAPEMKLIVECSGGIWRASGPKWVCVSCFADKDLWPELQAKGATIVSNEFILSGVLRQVADVDNNRLH